MKLRIIGGTVLKRAKPHEGGRIVEADGDTLLIEWDDWSFQREDSSNVILTGDVEFEVVD